MTTLIDYAYNALEYVFNNLGAARTLPNYNEHEFDYDNSPYRGCIGACDAGHKLDRILCAMIDLNELSPEEHGRITKYCSKTLRKANRYHKAFSNGYQNAETFVREEALSMLRQQLLSSTAEVCRETGISSGHPVENHLRSYVYALTSRYFLPMNKLYRMTFNQIREQYGMESLFGNRHLRKDFAEFNEIIRCVILNSRGCMVTPHDERLLELIKTHCSEEVNKMFLTEFINDE